MYGHMNPRRFRRRVVGVTQHIGVLAQIHVAGMAAIGACRSGRGCLTSKRWNMPAYSSNTCSLALLNSVIRVRSQGNGDDLPDGSNNRACGEYDVRNRWQQPTYQSIASMANHRKTAAAPLPSRFQSWSSFDRLSDELFSSLSPDFFVRCSEFPICPVTSWIDERMYQGHQARCQNHRHAPRYPRSNTRFMPVAGKLSRLRWPSAITPIVIQTTAMTRVGSDRTHAATNIASGKQIVSGERVFILLSPLYNGSYYSRLVYFGGINRQGFVPSLNPNADRQIAE
ncbi:hypothetical protein P3T25_008629 [Paraburkholderia sp. GAS32]